MTTTVIKDDKATGKAGKKDKKGADGAKKKSLFKSKKFIMIVVALLAVGGGAYKFLAPVAVVPPAAGEVVPLDATTVNLAAGHYLKIGVSVVLVAGKATLATFPTGQAAQLVITEFANRTVASLSTNSARESLQKQLKVAIQKAFPDPTCSAADLKLAATATSVTTTATPAPSASTTAKASATTKSAAANTPTAASTLLTCTQVFDVFITQFVTQ